jgi:hypothetical protein
MKMCNVSEVELSKAPSIDLIPLAHRGDLIHVDPLWAGCSGTGLRVQILHTQPTYGLRRNQNTLALRHTNFGE